MMKLQQLIRERRGHWAERAVGPTVPQGVLRKAGPTTDTRLKRNLEQGLRREAAWPCAAARRHDRDRDWPADVTDVMRELHDGDRFRFEILADLAGVDTGTEMQVVYHLYSVLTPDWLRVIAEGLERDTPRVASVTFLWTGAEWAEREAYDMFGIIFEGNRDLRRIYMPPDYTSFPLRKDFLLAR
jgi:NADH-quinone oxidoreductase subunit C